MRPNRQKKAPGTPPSGQTATVPNRGKSASGQDGEKSCVHTPPSGPTAAAVTNHPSQRSWSLERAWNQIVRDPNGKTRSFGELIALLWLAFMTLAIPPHFLCGIDPRHLRIPGFRGGTERLRIYLPGSPSDLGLYPAGALLHGIIPVHFLARRLLIRTRHH